jgi:transcriptional regulator with XRE-family HTH domain
MGVTQQDIADRVGLSRTTVTKILNRDPSYITSDETRRKVFEAAEELGYNFKQIRRPFRRRYGRADINTEGNIVLVFKDGEVFDKGEATVRNISAGGALLTNVRLAKGVLPIKRFSIILRIRDIKDLEDLVGECEIVRFTDFEETVPETHIGVRFLSISKRDQKRIEEYVTRYGTEDGSSPMLPKHD